MKNLENITNKVELIDFLKKESNNYSNFILERIDRNVKEVKTYTSIMHRHHIIPKHRSGPDKKFNIIELTPEEHAEAHQLLYLCYQDKNDLAAFHIKLFSKAKKLIKLALPTLDKWPCKKRSRNHLGSESGKNEKKSKRFL